MAHFQISRRVLLAGAGALAGVGPAGGATAKFPEAAYRQAVVIDGLAGSDPRVMAPSGLEALRASGVTALHISVNDSGNQPGRWESTLSIIAFIDARIAENPTGLVKVKAAADISNAKREGKVGLIYGVQDTSMVGTELDRLGRMRELGVRIVQLTYNLRNLSGDGALEPANAGLSKLGRATIARIEQERLLVDFSHGGQRTVAEGLAATTRPPIISHTGCRALNDNPRNVGDAELKACAKRGGVVGIYWMPFLVASGHPTGADLIRHMAHVRNICGEDCVSIGTDGMLSKTPLDDRARAAQKALYDRRAAKGIAAPGEGPDIFNIVEEWDDNMRFQHLADGLARARWSTSQIEKALGGNLLRLYGETFG